MSIAALVVVSALLAGPAPADAQRDRGRAPTGTRPHTIGVGGAMTVSNRGAGGGLRYWFGERVGVNLTANYYRGGLRQTGGSRSGSTFAAVPSIIVMLTGPHPAREVDIRPYVGGGVNYVRSSATTTTGTSALTRRSGTGGQVFGGVEMTFRDADWMTISAEGIYYSLPVSYVDASTIGGFNYVLAFHFYVK